MFGRSPRLYVAAALAALLIIVLTSCGGGSSSNGSAKSSASSSGASSGEVVAQVGATPITKPQVSHWMATLAGGDYYELSHHNTVPAELVSDPPRYSTCVSHLEASAAAAPRKLYNVTGVQLLTKCRQIYRALRAQATAFLVRALYVAGLAGDLGVTVSDQEALQNYKRSTAERFPIPAEATRYLSSRRATLTDELLVEKLDVLSQKTLAKLKAQGSSGPATLSQSEARWTAKTDCHPGYVVEHCKQFHGEAPHTAANPPASVLMEQVAAIAIGQCINIAACGKP
jgi:hypothetical protein